jgi:integrase
MRRGELLALRWSALDEENGCLKISEAVYDNRFDTPKTKAGIRLVPLPGPVLGLLEEWKRHTKRTAATDLVFGTRSGKPASANNMLRRQIFPACEKLGLPHATWLTFRRTYSSWSHNKGVPDKVTAALMGHSNVYTTLNVYTQVLDESKRLAADKIGQELFNIVQFSGIAGGKGSIDSTPDPLQNDEVAVNAGS